MLLTDRINLVVKKFSNFTIQNYVFSVFFSSKYVPGLYSPLLYGSQITFSRNFTIRTNIYMCLFRKYAVREIISE